VKREEITSILNWASKGAHPEFNSEITLCCKLLKTQGKNRGRVFERVATLAARS
jgi:hypothetical protein